MLYAHLKSENAAFNRVALVLDANQRSALAVTRSLGRRGVRVLTADSTLRSLAGSSRFSSVYLQAPSVTDDSAAFANWVRRIVLEYEVGFLIPVAETSMQALLDERHRLPGECVFPFPSSEILEGVIDKARLLRTAERLGVPVPRSCLAVPGSGDGGCPIYLTYPLVLKPTRSRIRAGGKWLAAPVAIASDHAEFVRLKANRLEFRDYPFLLQEFIPGTGAAIFCLYDRGHAVSFFAHKRLREKPPAGGVSVLSESAPLDATMVSFAQRLLDAAKWHGVAMVEFRVGPGGIPYLMEINTRFWGSLQLAIDSGVDFPWMLYQLGCGQPTDIPQEYLVGKRLRWFLGDLDSLYLRLRDHGTGFRHKAGSILEFLTPKPLSTRHEVFRWSDPCPGIYELQQYWAQFVRRSG